MIKPDAKLLIDEGYGITDLLDLGLEITDLQMMGLTRTDLVDLGIGAVSKDSVYFDLVNAYIEAAPVAENAKTEAEVDAEAESEEGYYL